MEVKDKKQELPKDAPVTNSHKPTITESIGHLKWLLEWAASSWKNLVTFVVMAAVLGIGFWAYTMPEHVRRMVIRSVTEPVIDLRIIEENQSELLKQTGAIGFSVDVVDFEQNMRRNVVFRVGERDVPSLAAKIEPMFPRDSPETVNHVVKMIHGQVSCIERTEANTSTKKLAVLKELGIVTSCSIGLPPGYTSYFKGILTVYYAEGVSVQQENLAELVLSRASHKIMENSY